MSEKENVYVTIIEGDNCYGLDELKVGETVKLVKEPNQFLNEKNELHNRSMHISGVFLNNKKVDIQAKKVDIQSKKVNIEQTKVNIESKLLNNGENVSSKTKEHILKLYDGFNEKEYFGRSDVESITGLKSVRATGLIKLMLKNDIIAPVKGHGKGKYRFSL